MSPYVGWVPRCAICRKSVDLSVSKTNENGRAVHENCYVWRLLSQKLSPSRMTAADRMAQLNLNRRLKQLFRISA